LGLFPVGQRKRGDIEVRTGWGAERRFLGTNKSRRSGVTLGERGGNVKLR